MVIASTFMLICYRLAYGLSMEDVSINLCVLTQRQTT